MNSLKLPKYSFCVCVVQCYSILIVHELLQSRNLELVILKRSEELVFIVLKTCRGVTIDFEVEF